MGRQRVFDQLALIRLKQPAFQPRAYAPVMQTKLSRDIKPLTAWITRPWSCASWHRMSAMARWYAACWRSQRCWMVIAGQKRRDQSWQRRKPPTN